MTTEKERREERADRAEAKAEAKADAKEAAATAAAAMTDAQKAGKPGSCTGLGPEGCIFDTNHAGPHVKAKKQPAA